MGIDAFGYQGRRVLVVGGATGMGNATARLVSDLGGEVVVMDHATVDISGVSAIRVDLRDRGGIDAALAECGGPIDALFACAGVADGTDGIELINFVGHRHLIGRAIAAGLLGQGAAIGVISSAAGAGWEAQADLINEVLDTPDFDAAVAWWDEHEDLKSYMFTKRVMAQYVARECAQFAKHGMRINAIMPGPTDTPLGQANKELWLDFGSDYREEIGVGVSTPEQQAYPLAFLCSDAASYVNGVTLLVDAGWFSAGLAGGFPPATESVQFLAGRFG